MDVEMGLGAVFPRVFCFPPPWYKTTEIESERISSNLRVWMPRPTPRIYIYIYTFCGHFESDTDTWFFKRFVEMRSNERTCFVGCCLLFLGVRLGMDKGMSL